MLSFMKEVRKYCSAPLIVFKHESRKLVIRTSLKLALANLKTYSSFLSSLKVGMTTNFWFSSSSSIAPF